MLNVMTRARLEEYEKYLLQVWDGQALRSEQSVYTYEAAGNEFNACAMFPTETFVGKRRNILKNQSVPVKEKTAEFIPDETPRSAEAATLYEDISADTTKAAEAENGVRHLYGGEGNLLRAVQTHFDGGENADEMQRISDYFRRGSRRYDGGFKRY